MRELPISMSRYMIDQRRAAQKAGQARPDTATLKSQYKQIFGKPTGNFQGPPQVSPAPAELPPSITQQTVKGGPAPDYGSMIQRTAPTGPGPGLAGVTGTTKINPTGGPVYGPGGTSSPPGTGGPGMPFGGQIGGAASGTPAGMTMKKGGKVKAKKMASGGMTSKVSSASSRADGIAQRGKTKCKMY